MGNTVSQVAGRQERSLARPIPKNGVWRKNLGVETPARGNVIWAKKKKTEWVVNKGRGKRSAEGGVRETI